MHKYLVICFLFCFGTLWSQDLSETYKNYTFVSGKRILFDDYGTDEKVSTLPSHWKIEGGEALITNKEGENCISINKYYTVLSPKISKSTYLADTFSVEFDAWLDVGYDGNPGVELHFRTASEEVAVLTPNQEEMRLKYPGGEATSKNVSEFFAEKFYNRWNRIAVYYVNKRIKVYLNQDAILLVENCNFKPNSVFFTGNKSQEMPILLKNVKIANGGIQIEKELSVGKFVSQNIRFEVGKSTLKAESFGILNQIAEFMAKNTSSKFEISGHTDSDGDDNLNLKLSQERAESVRKYLIFKGIDGARLTAIGQGETKPLNKNLNADEKAINRRVEVVGMK